MCVCSRHEFWFSVSTSLHLRPGHYLEGKADLMIPLNWLVPKILNGIQIRIEAIMIPVDSGY